MRRREHPRLLWFVMGACVVSIIGWAIWFIPTTNHRTEQCKATYGQDAGYSIAGAECTLHRPLP